jgi:cholesterol transport system auxiliary component
MKRLLLLAALLVAGCSLPVSRDAEDVTHTLALTGGIAASAVLPAGRTLAVAPLTAAPGYASPSMAYRASANELRYFAHQRWVDRPARLIEQALVDGLSGAGVPLVVAGSGAQPDLRLVTDLVAFEQDFTVKPSRVRLVLRVQLVDVRGRRLLGGDTLRFEQAAPSDDAAGGVVAANALLGRAVGEVASFCRRVAGA